MGSLERGRPARATQLCVNRGSEVYEANEGGLELVEARAATPEENAALVRPRSATVEELAGGASARRSSRSD